VRHVLRRRVVVVLVLLGGLTGAGWLGYRRAYPYGWSHSCDKGLMFALMHYAQDHGGDHPKGEATPEASLSLLYPKYANEYVLQGKTIPIETVQAALADGGKLGPDTCGWHYVEGLQDKDHRRFALVWDKVGLGHNGERLRSGGHFVIFVGGEIEYIPESNWGDFLQEQEQLHKKRSEPQAK
jgi:hypothetical protein